VSSANISSNGLPEEENEASGLVEAGFLDNGAQQLLTARGHAKSIG